MPMPPNSPLQNNKGMAILLALFSMVLLLVLAVSVAYDTTVEYNIAAQGVSRLKAHYAAKAGVELSLLRILIYKKAVSSFGDKIKDNPQAQSMINMVWQFPLTWPPMVTDDMNPVAKDKIATTVKESFMDAQYSTKIEGESGKIDVNDLGSPVKEISEATKKSLLQIFETELANNADFQDKNSNAEFDELVNAMADWVDEDTEGRNSGDESQGYTTPTDSDITLPPNRAFRTVDEIRMVAGMTEEYFSLLKDRVTVFGSKGINPNNASELVLKSLDPQIDDEALGKIIERRTSLEKGGPFKDNSDFFSFLRSVGVNPDNLEGKEIPFFYDAEYNFRIHSTGRHSNIVKDVKVITFDVENLSQRYAQFLKKSEEAQNGGSTTTTTLPPPGGGAQPTEPGVKFKSPKGRPTVVYWEEN